jgi:hypothetical protein
MTEHEHDAPGSRYVTHDDLVDALRQVAAEHDDLAGKHAAVLELIGDLGKAVARVSGKVQELADHDVEMGRARWRWRTLPPGPTRVALWHQVAAFVAWYNHRYGHSAQGVALWPCWASHPVVVEELTALMVAHDAAYAGDDPTDAIIAWHDRWLWPAIDRLHTRPGGFKTCTAMTHDLRHTVDVPQIDAPALAAAIADDATAAADIQARLAELTDPAGDPAPDAPGLAVAPEAIPPGEEPGDGWDR